MPGPGDSALNQLCIVGLASRLPPENNEPFQAHRYQPAKPLDKIRLLDFKQAFENHGEAHDEGQFDQRDPAVQRYNELINQARAKAFESVTIESLLVQVDDPKD